MTTQLGIIDAAPSWVQLLEQEGVPWMSVRPEELGSLHVSAVIADRPLLGTEAAALRAYLAGGGAVLGAARYLTGVLGMSWRRQRVRYLTDQREEGSCWVDLLDVETEAQIPREANTLRTDDGSSALFAGERLGGVAVVLPFDVRDLWTNDAAGFRKFWARFERFPYERVAAASRGELLRLVHSSLEFLHHMRGLPYARLWPYPDGAPSVLAYRLDTDRANRAQVEAFHALSRELGIPFSWFVDTSSHEGWLERFAEMEDQEVGIHCRHHRTYSSPGGYTRDIGEARQMLKDAGADAHGYAAPFGIWNPALAEALEEAAMPFSSEFGIGYDTLPFRPERPGRRYQTLQVPVHPVSAGALRRAGFTAGRMEVYFADLIRRKMARGEPLFLYDHPLHGYNSLGRTVLQECRAAGAVPVTLGGFGEWWRERSLVLQRLGSRGLANLPAAAGALAERFRVHRSTGEGEVLLPALDPAGWSVPPLAPRAAPRPPENIRAIREFDLRTTVGTAVTTLTRRRQQ